MLSHFSCVQLSATPWTVVQVPLSTGFSRQEHWSGLPFPPPGDLPDPGNEPASLISPELAGGLFTTSTTWEAYRNSIVTTNQNSVIDIQKIESNTNIPRTRRNTPIVFKESQKTK